MSCLLVTNRKPTAEDFEVVERNLGSLSVETQRRRRRRQAGNSDDSEGDSMHGVTRQQTATRSAQPGAAQAECHRYAANSTSDGSSPSAVPDPVSREHDESVPFKLAARKSCPRGDDPSDAGGDSSESPCAKISQARCGVPDQHKGWASGGGSIASGEDASRQTELPKDERVEDGQEERGCEERAEQHGENGGTDEADGKTLRDCHIWPHWNTVCGSYKDLRAQRLFLLKVLGFQEKDDIFADPPPPGKSTDVGLEAVSDRSGNGRARLCFPRLENGRLCGVH